MRKKRIYVDTSVIYGAPDQKFSQDSRKFWESVRQDKIMIIVSGVLDAEIDRAPTYVRALFRSIPETRIERVPMTIEANHLAIQYVTEGVVGEKSLDDCRHIALATIAHADSIVSWNLKHMVGRHKEYNSVNRKHGYPEINIQNPKQFMEDYNDKT